MPEPGAPEAQRIDQRLGKDDLIAGRERGEVPHAAVRAGQIQVRRRAGPQPVPGLAAIQLGHVPVLIEDRDDE